MSSFGSDGANADPRKQLFVRMNGPSSLQLPSLQVLRLLFQRFGNVVKITSSKDGRSAFVTFATPEQAQAAKKAMNDHDGFNESNGVNLVRTLFVDFAMERGTKPAPRPIHVEAPRSAPRPAHVEAPRPAPRPAYVEAQRSAPRQAPVEAPKSEPALIPAPPQKPVLDVASANLPLVYIFPGQRPKIISKPAMALLFDLGSPPQTKFQGDTDVLIFGDGIQWVIPHPDNFSAIQECQEKYKSGTYSVQIPREVLTSKKFWRD